MVKLVVPTPGAVRLPVVVLLNVNVQVPAGEWELAILNAVWPTVPSFGFAFTALGFPCNVCSVTTRAITQNLQPKAVGISIVRAWIARVSGTGNEFKWAWTWLTFGKSKSVNEYVTG